MKRTIAVAALTFVVALLLLGVAFGQDQGPALPAGIDPETHAILALVNQLQAQQGSTSTGGVYGVVVGGAGVLLALVGGHRAGLISLGSHGGWDSSRELGGKLDAIQAAVSTLSAQLQTHQAVTEQRLETQESEIDGLREMKHQAASMSTYKEEVERVSAQLGRLDDHDRRLARLEGRPGRAGGHG